MNSIPVQDDVSVGTAEHSAQGEGEGGSLMMKRSSRDDDEDNSSCC